MTGHDVHSVQEKIDPVFAQPDETWEHAESLEPVNPDMDQALEFNAI